MCQTVFSLGYYGIKKTTKTYKSQGMQLSPMKTANVTFENSERDLWVLDATDKCATVCHAISKSLVLIASTEIIKLRIFYLENIGAERFKIDWDWCYAKE